MTTTKRIIVFIIAMLTVVTIVAIGIVAFLGVEDFNRVKSIQASGGITTTATITDVLVTVQQEKTARGPLTYTLTISIPTYEYFDDAGNKYDLVGGTKSTRRFSSAVLTHFEKGETTSVTYNPTNPKDAYMGDKDSITSANFQSNFSEIYLPRYLIALISSLIGAALLMAMKGVLSMLRSEKNDDK